MKILLAILLLAASLEAKKPRKPQPPTVPCAPGPRAIPLDNQWRVSGAWYGSDTTPFAISGGGIGFNFPNYSTRKYAGYLLRTTACIAGSGYLTVTIRVATTGTPIFMFDSEPGNTGSTPANVRPYFESGSNEYQRWWANPDSYTLAAGTATLTVPLTPDRWSSVFGKFGNFDTASLAGFSAAMRQTKQIGMTFGGGYFFGHGVNVKNGTAQFQVLSYSTF